MNSIGKKAVCLEVGSIVDDVEMTVAIAKKHIRNFLSGIKKSRSPVTTFQKPETKKCSTIYHATYGKYIPTKQFCEFEFVKKGTLLCYDGSELVYMPHDGTLLFSRNTYELGEECFVVVI